MKTTKKIFAVIFGLAISGAVLASEAGNLKVNMASSEAKATFVEISSTKVSNFEIEVMDAYGETLYEMKTEAPASGLNKRYDFSQLEDGVYSYSVKIDKERKVQTFEVDNGQITVINSRKSIDPYFKYENDMVKFSYLNPQGEDVKLYVYDNNNQLLAEAELGNAFSIQRAIDFSDKRWGDYSVVLTNDFDVHEFDVSIR